VVEQGGRPQIIVSATHRIRGYDLTNGKLVWECGGLSQNVVASPVAGAGMVYAGSSYDTRALLAIRLDSAKGDITGTPAVVWARERDTPYVPSLLLDGDALCFVKHIQPFLTCVEAKTGKTLFGPERLPGIDGVYASPVGAAGRVYVVGRGGTTVVLRRGAPFETLAQNTLDDTFAASPAIAGDELYLRGERYLYCLAEGPSPRVVDSTEFSPPNSLR
jgi:outer membrane protein assembly factor BamB